MARPIPTCAARILLGMTIAVFAGSANAQTFDQARADLLAQLNWSVADPVLGSLYGQTASISDDCVIQTLQILEPVPGIEDSPVTGDLTQIDMATVRVTGWGEGVHGIATGSINDAFIWAMAITATPEFRGFEQITTDLADGVLEGTCTDTVCHVTRRFPQQDLLVFAAEDPFDHQALADLFARVVDQCRP